MEARGNEENISTRKGLDKTTVADSVFPIFAWKYFVKE
jgi:hypothetical protein